MCDSKFYTPKTRVFSQGMPMQSIKAFLILIATLIVGINASAQCLVYDGKGNAVNNPTWVSCSGGAHEVSLIYEIASDRKKRKRRRSRFIIPCAKF